MSSYVTSITKFAIIHDTYIIVSEIFVKFGFCVQVVSPGWSRVVDKGTIGYFGARVKDYFRLFWQRKVANTYSYRTSTRNFALRIPTRSGMLIGIPELPDPACGSDPHPLRRG